MYAAIRQRIADLVDQLTLADAALEQHGDRLPAFVVARLAIATDQAACQMTDLVGMLTAARPAPDKEAALFNHHDQPSWKSAQITKGM